ncbi:helix-turn-helix transcriptional regulator [Halopseudomonas phragmitis]|uniref:Peptidase S24/S26A/S26B/S26C domain-containing protein n=1 Tax=Halopseudomonas phragmitis TaxID=1931241 RepID=A0A1V0B9N1_9GAMM|nr:helix-turn-helix transcriptional regulator [Halopseudomonas phragmitis]AQZ96648.1 hypothetical protein BVH74_18655 [Halopseudomonas phragmitis]
MKIHDIRRANLAAIIETKFSGKQSAFAAAVERQASYINRCLLPPENKHSKPIGEKIARHIEKALNLSPLALDSPIGYSTEERQSFSVSEPTTHYGLSPVEPWDDETPLGEDEIELPFFKEVEISAGTGSEVMLETTGRKLRFGRRTLQRKNITPECAACATVTGNSMEPVLPDGTTVGIDTSQTIIKDGQMYAIDHDGQLRIKVLYRKPGSGLRIHSYNSSEHPDEIYDPSYVNEKIRVIGKVFWYSVLL